MRDRNQIYVFHASAGHELLTEAAAVGRVSRSVKLKGAVLLRLERRCIRRADAVVVLSDFSRRLIEQLHPTTRPQRVVVIPGGTTVEPELSSDKDLSPRSGRLRRIVVLRRLEWRMGVDILFEAFAGSTAQKEGWQLDIVGTGSQEQHLKTFAAELGIGDSVIFHGRVSEEKKTQILEAATLSVLPTRALEGFGLATVEAMSHGVIPIVTSAGASPEIVLPIDERLICEPAVESIRSSIDYWACERSDNELSEIRTACRTRAQEFSWESVFAAYETLIKSLPSATFDTSGR
nr:glycosyltransferase [Arthrobacter sp. ISL-72]